MSTEKTGRSALGDVDGTPAEKTYKVVMVIMSYQKCRNVVEFPRFYGHPELHMRPGFWRVSKYHLPSEDATTALYVQGIFLTLTWGCPSGRLPLLELLILRR